MKKILLLATLLCGALFSSCEKELTSLDGTTWTDDNSTLVFTSTHATYTHIITYSDGSQYDKGFTGTYTYDQPTVTITTTIPGEGGIPITVDMTGTIKKKIMTIGIHETADLVRHTDLEKQ